MITAIVSLATFITYMTYVIIKFGVPPSISETWYLLQKKGILFTLFCYGVSAVLIPLLDNTTENLQFLTFFAVSGLLFVGTATAFKEELTKQVHFTSAAICVIASQLWILIYAKDIIIMLAGLLIVGLAYFTHRYKTKNNYITFWVEIYAFVTLYASLFKMLISNQ
jgi:hypothetical protein